MNNHFSFNRFGLLVRKQWGEHARLYGLGMIAISGLLSLVFFLWVIGHGDDNHFDQSNFYLFGVIGFFISGSIFASIQFSSLAQKDKALQWLSTPATHFEKLACSVFFSLIVFNLFYVLCFLLIKTLGFYILGLDASREITGIDWDRDNAKTVFRYAGLGYIAIQSIYLLGSVYFSRYSFIKTTIAGLIIFVAFLLFINNVLRPAFLHGGNLWSFASFRTWQEQEGEKLYSLPGWIEHTMKFIAYYAWAPVCWTVTLFRLKEKEV
jgi:hypothetical protein